MSEPRRSVRGSSKRYEEESGDSAEQAPPAAPKPTGKPRLNPGEKKRGRPSKEIQWDDNYTGPLRRCAYTGHEELWGADVPVELQPQYFYATTARCIYCYKHLCNERHANKVKNGGASTATKKKGGRRKNADDDDEEEGGSKRTGGRSSSRKRSKAGEDDWSKGGRRSTPAQQAQSHPPANVLHNAQAAKRNFFESAPILQEWGATAIETLEYVAPSGSETLNLKMGGAPRALEVGQSVQHGTSAVMINATPRANCVGWVSSDDLVIAGGSQLHVWGRLQSSAPRLYYTLELEGGDVVSFVVLPRSGKPKVRMAAVAAVHADGRVRLHSLPWSESNEPLLLRQTEPAPISPVTAAPVQSLAVSTHPSHPNRLIVGHQDGSLRWLDLPPSPSPQLPAFQGSGGAGFSIAAAGYLPTSDAAFWAVGESASVAIGDIREPFGGPVAPPSSGAHTESYLKTADSSIVFPALVAGGDGGHVWALPWAGENTPPPRLLCSLNGAALSIKCHPFLPLAITGCASGAARALWLPVASVGQKAQQQLVIHAASFDDEYVIIDSPSDLNDQGFRHAGQLACVAASWAPDVDGRYALVHANGLVRVGILKEFVLRSAGA